MNKKMIAAVILFVGTLAWAADTVFQTEVLMFGKPAAGTKTLKFRKSVSTTQPGIRWGGSAMQFSNDGTSWQNIGTGGTSSSYFFSSVFTGSSTNTASFFDIATTSGLTTTNASARMILTAITGNLELQSTGGINPEAEFEMGFDGITICQWRMSTTTTNTTIKAPLSASCTVNGVVAGNHIAKIRARVVTINTTLSWSSTGVMTLEM